MSGRQAGKTRAWSAALVVALAAGFTACSSSSPAVPDPTPATTSASTGASAGSTQPGVPTSVVGSQASALGSALGQIRRGLASGAATGTNAPAGDGTSLKDLSTSTTLSVSLPKDCTFASLSADDVYEYSCARVKGMLAYVSLDLTSKSVMNAANFASHAAQWFRGEKVEDDSTPADPLDYWDGKKVQFIELATVFDTADTNQTFGAKYYKDTSSNLLSLYGVVTDAKAGTLEFDLEIPYLSDASALNSARQKMNADFAELGISLSDALHSHG